MGDTSILIREGRGGEGRGGEGRGRGGESTIKTTEIFYQKYISIFINFGLELLGEGMSVSLALPSVHHWAIAN